MDQCVFTGTCTALVTPFLDNKVNYPMMDMLIAVSYTHLTLPTKA